MSTLRSTTIRASVIFLTLTLSIIVQCQNFSPSDSQKLGKQSKKATELQSPKKFLNKKSDTPSNVDEYENINLNHSNLHDTQQRSRDPQEQERNSLNAIHGKSSKRIENQNQANRVKRDTTKSELSEGYKETRKNYKKVKLAQSFAEGKSNKKKEYYGGVKWGKYVEDGINGMSKKRTVRRHIREPRIMRKIVLKSQNRGNVNRLKRDVLFGSHKELRANATDYYAQRRAVMERFYARQREITERIAKQFSTTPRSLLKYDLKFDLDGDNGPSTKRINENQIEEEEITNSNNLSSDLSSSVKSSTVATLTAQEQAINVTPKNDFNYNLENGFKNELKNNTNVERDASQYYTNTPNCDNIPRSGNFAGKQRSKDDGNCADDHQDPHNEQDDTQSSDVDEESFAQATNSQDVNSRRWGTCTGKVVYQHNLLLGLKGPSNLDTMFEVAIQGPICITCVETVRYNETRAIVTLESGGRGYQFIKLKLKGFENEGFSYIVKVWGIRKIGNFCEK